MGAWSEDEVRRVGALAMLALEDAEVARLASECGDIADAFGDLAAFAAGLPAPDAPAAGTWGPDEAAPAIGNVVDDLTALFPHVDGDGHVRAPRGSE